MQTIWMDTKHTLRWLARSPGFAAAALTTLALGIGATTAIASLVYGVLLRPLPFREPDRLAFITREGDVSLPDGDDWRAGSRSFESIGLFARAWAFDLTGQGDPEPVTAHAAEPQFFDVLAIAPLRGRLFSAAENQPGAAHVIVITEGFWASRFHREPSAVGRTVTLSGNPATIIGVLPREVDFLDDGIIGVVPISVELPWAPANRGTNNLDAIGRLKPSVPFAEARSEMIALTTRLAAEYPESNRGKIVTPISLADFVVGSVRTSLWLVMAAVATLLAIGAVNLAGLLLARTTARRQELAVRTALGAARTRLAAQLVTEGLVLALAGGGLGVVAAVVTHRLLLQAVPDSVPRTADLGIRWPIVLLGAGLSVAVGLVCGLVPAWQATRRAPGSALGGSARGTATRSRHRPLKAIVAAEVALAMMLLVGAGLVGRSFQRLWARPLGFDPEGVLLADLVLPESRFSTPAPQSVVFTGVIDRLAATPGVRQAAFVTTAPLNPRGGIGTKILFEGRPDVDPTTASGARVRFTYGPYFEALSIPVVHGRGFAPSDDERAPSVAVINEQMAREFFAGRDPVGQRIALKKWDDQAKGDHWLTIVGVVGDIRGTTLADADSRAVYVPYLQRRIWWERFGVIAVRTDGAPMAMAPAVKRAVGSVDPLLTVGQVRPLVEVHRGAAGRERFLAVILGLFAALSLGLVVQGLWSIVSFAVAERRREFGVRMALGSTGPGVLLLALRHALAPTLAGAGVGLGAAVALSRLIGTVLYDVSPTDPMILTAAATLLPLVALAAAAVPAGRAARLDPLTAMQE